MPVSLDKLERLMQESAALPYAAGYDLYVIAARLALNPTCFDMPSQRKTLETFSPEVVTPLIAAGILPPRTKTPTTTP